MIKVENLSRQYGAKKALDGLSFTAENGSVLIYRRVIGTGIKNSTEQNPDPEPDPNPNPNPNPQPTNAA